MFIRNDTTMPAFYSPTTGEKRFTHYPRGILDGTDDEYEFDDVCGDESVASCRRDCESQDDEEDTAVPDETEIVAKKKREAAVPSSIVVVTKRKETPFELLKRLEEDESEDEEFNKMLETPIFSSKVAKKPSPECNSEKENMGPDPIQVKTEIDDNDMDKKPAAKTKEQLESEKKMEWKEEIDNGLFDEHLQKVLDDHFGEVRRPFKMINLKSDLKWKAKDKKVKKEVKKRKKTNRQAAPKRLDEPPIKKRKLTAQEKQDQAYAHSLHIQEILRMTRGSL